MPCEVPGLNATLPLICVGPVLVVADVAIMPKLAAEPNGIAGPPATGGAQVPTVKLQTRSLVNTLPGTDRSLTPVAPPLMVAV